MTHKVSREVLATMRCALREMESTLRRAREDAGIAYSDKEYAFQCETAEEQLAVRIKQLMTSISALNHDLALFQPMVREYLADDHEDLSYGYLVNLIDDDGDVIITTSFRIDQLDDAKKYTVQEILDGTCSRATLEATAMKLESEFRLE